MKSYELHVKGKRLYVSVGEGIELGLPTTGRGVICLNVRDEEVSVGIDASLSVVSRLTFSPLKEGDIVFCVFDREGANIVLWAVAPPEVKIYRYQ